MNTPTPERLAQFLERLGQRCPFPAEVYLFGGSALLLIGRRRNTADVDFTLHTAPDRMEELRQAIATLAIELNLDLEESIPAEFMPLPSETEARHQLIGRYGQLTAFIFDPYSMALMKLDRAFPTDVEDVHFLIHNGHITLDFLEQCLREVESRYEEPKQLRRNFEEMKRGL